MRLALIGTPLSLALHGAEGGFGDCRIRSFAPSAAHALASYEPDVALALLGDGEQDVDDAVAAGRDAGAVTAVWRYGPGDAAAVPTLAPGGAGLWRRAPLPAADGLFAFARQAGDGVLVVGGDEAAREAVVERLAGARFETRARQRPAAADLAWAAVVAVLGEAEQPIAAVTFAAAAAGRVVLAPRALPAFGLAPDVDYLIHGSTDELAHLATAVLEFPEAFAPVAAMGRLTAEAHRASVVYGRIGADLAAS